MSFIERQSRRPRRWLVLATSVAAFALMTTGCAPEDEVQAIVPAGTTVVATLDDRVSTGEVKLGDQVELTTAEPVLLEGDLALPQGTIVLAEVTEVTAGNDGATTPELTIEFRAIEVDGEEYPISAEPVDVAGRTTLEPADTTGREPTPTDTMRDTLPDPMLPEPRSELIVAGIVVPTEEGEVVLAAGRLVRITLAQPATVRVPREGVERGDQYSAQPRS